MPAPTRVGPRVVADPETAYEIGTEAYIYLYPLVLMDVTRRVMTNVETVGEVAGRGPTNAFAHARTFLPAGFSDVIRPNVDTLYSLAWLDLTREPQIVSAGDAGDHYYLLPMYDMWSDIFASPGTRTTGNGPGHFAVVPHGWEGELPAGARRIESSTPYVWVIGRTQCDGPADYANVHRFQGRLSIVPLSRWGKKPVPARGEHDASVDGDTPPQAQVEQMSTATFFAYAAELMKLHPPHFDDYPVLHRMERIGLTRGESFDLFAAPTVVRDALDRAVLEARIRVFERRKQIGLLRDGWLMNTEAVASYGTDYLRRATIDLIGLSANLPEDAIYPLAWVDADGQALDGAHRYVLHFGRGEMPPAHAFWSLTIYDDDGYTFSNPLERFSLGSRDPLRLNRDRTLDLFIQQAAPERRRVPNWLPAPEGGFNLVLRLYQPKLEALDGTWAPPGLRRLD